MESSLYECDYGSCSFIASSISAGFNTGYDTLDNSADSSIAGSREGGLTSRIKTCRPKRIAHSLKDPASPSASIELPSIDDSDTSAGSADSTSAPILRSINPDHEGIVLTDNTNNSNAVDGVLLNDVNLTIVSTSRASSVSRAISLVLDPQIATLGRLTHSAECFGSLLTNSSLSTKEKIPVKLLKLLSPHGVLCFFRRLLQRLMTILKGEKLFNTGFERLPSELQAYFLKFFLVAPGEILTIGVTKNLIGDVKYVNVPLFFRPAILRTNKSMYAKGMNLLYGYNTWELARQVSSSLVNDPRDIAEFFSLPHLALVQGIPNPFNTATVPRSSLIKKIRLRDCDYDFPGFGLMGSAPPRLLDPLCTNIRWQFATLRHMYRGLKIA